MQPGSPSLCSQSPVMSVPFVPPTLEVVREQTKKRLGLHMPNNVGLPTLVSYGSVEAALQSIALSLLIRAIQVTLQPQLHRYLPGAELPGLSSEVRAQAVSAPSDTIASERSSRMADVAWKRAF
ncbi:hypothetical protein PoB_005827400 [Plakobranchus ocellatus]|uniref:Uncharacterized protein n=1 Tax=Plakobranchus ocellatus TaxID=259542 RepID=A0AAV4CL91_9GAST|nr:hypothetical protein PoB_005827400 [Plakobranchus ocellatus]